MRLHSVTPRAINPADVHEQIAQGRLATIAETVGLLATVTRDHTDPRGPLLALVVQAQLWLADLDDNTPERAA